MANVYDFRSGRSYKNISAQDVGIELERIRAERGHLKPADVLEEARSETSPLHAAFEWRDDIAAEKHRLTQARQLIVSVRVLNSPVGKPAVAFVSVKTPGQGRSYVPTTEALSDEELKVRVLTEARVFIESLERRYSAFTEIADLLSRLKKQVG